MQIVQVSRSRFDQAHLVVCGRVVAIGGVSVPRVPSKSAMPIRQDPRLWRTRAWSVVGYRLPYAPAQTSQNLVAVCALWACTWPCLPGRNSPVFDRIHMAGECAAQTGGNVLPDIRPRTDHQMQTNAWPKSGQIGGHVYAVARLLQTLNRWFRPITIIEGYRVLVSRT